MKAVSPANIDIIGNKYTRIGLITPKENYADLKSWIKENAGLVDDLYKKEKVLLFKGFSPLPAKSDFSEIVSITSEGNALDYSEPSTPRTKVQDRIYTSTEYPKEQRIPQHNEHSYSNYWPQKIFFYCENPAETGGQTPICSSSAVYNIIPDDIINRFKSKGGVMYVRNFMEEMDIQWNVFFGSDDKKDVEEYCKNRNIRYKWLEDDKLRIYQVSQAIIEDKSEDRKFWFNQAHLFHYSNLNAEVSQYLVDTYGKENLPRNSYYADGSEIALSDLGRIRQAYEEVIFRFEWEAGDLLMMNNVWFSHGRDPYAGARSILVSMSEKDHISNYLSL